MSENQRTNEWHIYAIKSGTVIHSFYSNDYGNTVLIRDNAGLTVRYAHLESLILSVGDTVIEGQVAGVMGATGRGIPKPNKHLHISVYPANITSIFNAVNARIINPMDYIREGTYPANTYISTGFLQMIGNPQYQHEGVDFSGRQENLIPDWQNGIPGTFSGRR